MPRSPRSRPASPMNAGRHRAGERARIRLQAPGSARSSWNPGWRLLTVTPSPATSRRQRLQEAGRPGSGGVRQDQPRDRLADRDRRDRDDPAPVLGLHGRDRGLAHRDRREAVELERPRVGVEVVDAPRSLRAAVRRRWPRGCRRRRGRRSRPARTRTRPPRCRRRRRAGRTRVRSATRPPSIVASVTAADRDLHALARQRGGGGEAESPRRRGHRGAPSFDPEVHRSFLCCSRIMRGSGRCCPAATRCPVRPVRTAMISAQIAIAASSGVRDPMSRPIGAMTRAARRRRPPPPADGSTRAACVRRDPIAPRYPTSVVNAATIAGTSNFAIVGQDADGIARARVAGRPSPGTGPATRSRSRRPSGSGRRSRTPHARRRP